MTVAELQIVDRFGGLFQIMEAPSSPSIAPHAFVPMVIGSRLWKPWCGTCHGGLLHEIHETARIAA